MQKKCNLTLKFAFYPKIHILLSNLFFLMVNVAQLAEHQIVALGVVGSNPTIHPIFKAFSLLFYL